MTRFPGMMPKGLLVQSQSIPGLVFNQKSADAYS